MNQIESHIAGSKPVIVDFSADWSVPCTLMGPVMHEVNNKVGGRATIFHVDIDKNPTFAERYAVLTVPTLIIFKDGMPLWRKSGVVPAHEILENLDMHIE
jgi:thioredoxin 1